MPASLFRRAAGSVGLLAAGIALHLDAQSPPPVTLKKEVADTYFGTVVVDPYRWMEAPTAQNPEFRSWLEAQNRFTRSALDRIPGRAELAARILALDDSTVSVGPLDIAVERWFYLKSEPGAQSRKLYVRSGPTGPERLLLDPDTMPAPGNSHNAVDYLQPSPNGKYLAYGLSSGGSEKSVLHIMDVSSGRVLPDAIDRAQFPAVSWSPDGRSFFYNRLSAAGDSNPALRYRNSRAYRHVVGRAGDSDEVLLGAGLAASVPIGPDDFPIIVSPQGSRQLLALVTYGVQNEVTAYAARRESLRGSSTKWVKLVDLDDQVTALAVHGDDVFLLSHKDAPRFKVLRTRLGSAGPSPVEEVLPAGTAVIESISAAGDALYVQALEGGLGRLLRLPYGGGPATRITLPVEGAIDFVVTDPRRPGATFRLQSWTRSPLWYAYDPATRSVRDTRVVGPSPVDFSKMESAEVQARSGDGTMVPLSIVYPKGLRLDGTHPTLLDGYGSYGFSINPFFRPSLLAWLERGGVYAVAHVRGGGENGEDWHLAGKGAQKPNTVADFIACAEYLIKQGYTSSSRLSGTGTSAGGITIGRAITQRPDLFRAAIPRVGVLNALRVEHEPGGPANIPEFGTTATESGFRALLAMDALHEVKPGTRYPAVLLTAGINDSRVEAWQPAKMAAALQEASTSGYPILLRVDFDAGHGMGLTKSQRSAELADIYAFLLWQLGPPGVRLSP
jgi:prolyl oligopeptidase